MSKIALVRRPGPRLDEGLTDYTQKVPVDLALAIQQWEQYVELLATHGWTIVEVSPVDDCPDAVFVEDTVVMARNVAVLTNPGTPSRVPEVPGTYSAVKDLGCSLNRVVAPGTLDGGDVLKVGDTVYVGRGGRTNAEGIAALRRILTPLGMAVVTVPVTKVLHLKTAITALPDGTVIGYEPYVDDPSLFPRFLPVPEALGAAVVCLSETEVVMSASAPKTAQMLRDMGYTVYTTPISEFEKLEGCVTCLSVRVRDLLV